LAGLLCHSSTDFGYAVADAHDSGLTARVEKTSTALIHYPAAFTANRDGIVFAKISGE
jgi:hypothetical protein